MPETSESRPHARADGKPSASRPFHFDAPSQEDRIRMVFGMPDKAPIPTVTENTLATYHDYLIERLTIPFDALYCQNGGKMRQPVHYIKVAGLIEYSPGRNHVAHGLFCTAENNGEAFEAPLVEIGVAENSPNCQLLDDYAYWFVNWR
ncbi:MAG: hypothetical protein JW959_03010 [Pirellulales bacterium]|nr:hypothetical protein [Pirellulales bacterium]